MTSTERSARRNARLRAADRLVEVRQRLLSDLYRDMLAAGLLEWSERVAIVMRTE